MFNDTITLKETIIWCAEERMKSGMTYQNLNAAIHAVLLDVVNELMMEMAKKKGGENGY